MNRLRFNLNGRWVEESALSPTTTLLRYLRDVRHLTGTKEGCAEGDCGACTVVVIERDEHDEPVFRAVNSCLLFLPMLQGKHVFTVEALAEATGAGQERRYHPAQEELAKAMGSQCGYCTPGVVMTLFEATYRKDLNAPWKLDDQLAGNLCRCTGYRPIREAARAVASRRPLDRFQSLLTEGAPTSMALSYEAGGQRFITPETLGQLWDALEAHPEARLLAGGTDLALLVTKRFERLPTLVSLEGIPELKALEETPRGLRLGATATVAELESFSEARLPPLHRMARYFGARQIKHRATVGGNLCNASPIGDLPPVLLSLDATAVVGSRAGERSIPLDQFFLAYRRTALGPGEVLLRVEVPPLPPTVRAVAYKVSKRRELDISIVSAGFLVETDARGLVDRARLAYGGMAATPRRALGAEEALLGKPWSPAAVELAVRALDADFAPISDHRGSAAYRRSVAANLLRGFYEETLHTPQPALARHHAATVAVAEGVTHA